MKLNIKHQNNKPVSVDDDFNPSIDGIRTSASLNYGEKILDMVHMVEGPAGWYDLYYTTDRIIAAWIGSPPSLLWNLTPGGAMLGKVAADMVKDQAEDRSYELSILMPHNILLSDPRNISLSYNSIEKIEALKPKLSSSPMLKIFLMDSHYDFIINKKVEFEKSIDLTNYVLPNNFSLV